MCSLPPSSSTRCCLHVCNAPHPVLCLQPQNQWCVYIQSKWWGWMNSTFNSCSSKGLLIPFAPVCSVTGRVLLLYVLCKVFLSTFLSTYWLAGFWLHKQNLSIPECFRFFFCLIHSCNSCKSFGNPYRAPYMLSFHRQMSLDMKDTLRVAFLLNQTKMDARQSLSIFLDFLHSCSHTCSQADPWEYQYLSVIGNHTKYLDFDILNIVFFKN